MVTLGLEGLELGQNGRSTGNRFMSSKQLGLSCPVCLLSVLGLYEWLAVCPPIALSPRSVENIKYLSQVSKETLVKGSGGLEVLIWGHELSVRDVMPQDWCSGDQLLVDPNIGAVLMTMRRQVFWQIFMQVKRSPEGHPGHIVMG